MRRVLILALAVTSLLSIWVLARTSQAPADPQRSHELLGGARGLVHNLQGKPLEGIGVQLISPKTAIRTTV